MNRRSEKVMKGKGLFLFITFIVVFMLLIGQLTYIVFYEGKNYNLEVLQNTASRQSSVTLNAKRGEIVDRNGIVLAESVKTYNLIFDARLLSQQDETTQDETVQYLHDTFDFDKDELEDKIEDNSDSSYDIIGSDYSYDEFKSTKEAIDSYELIGVFYEESYKRQYNYPTLASDVIGFVNADNEGAYGIESSYNEYLEGTQGREYGVINDDNHLESNTVESSDGDDVMLTLDYTVQKYIKDAIENFNEEYEADRVQVIVMNPNNGEIYGMGEYPDFDESDPYDLSVEYDEETIASMTDAETSEALNKLWKNEVLTNAYEPGSTYKPFVYAAALEENTSKPGETYICNGSLQVADTLIHCWKPAGHGVETITEALENSCNVAFMQIGAELGRNLYYKYQHMFGFGAVTNIDLPGEVSARSLLHTEDELNEVELATSSFGQTFAITPIQLITGFASLINGGYLYEPHIMKKVYNDDQIVENYSKKLVRQVISNEVSDATREALGSVVDEGTGAKAKIAGYEIGGKTGTAETIERDDEHYIVSFIGFAPVDNPQVLTLVVVDHPRAAEVDSRFAASVFVDVMEKVMPYLHIYKDDGTTSDDESTDEDSSQDDEISTSVDTVMVTEDEADTASIDSATSSETDAEE